MPGKTRIIETGREVTLLLDADRATLQAGGDKISGRVEVATGGRNGRIATVGRLWADDPAPAEGPVPTRILPGGGVLELSDSSGETNIRLRGGNGAVQARVLRAEDDEGKAGVRLDGPEAKLTIGGHHPSAKFEMIDSRGLPFVQAGGHWLKLGTPADQKGDVAIGNGGTLMMYNNSGDQTVYISGFNTEIKMGEAIRGRHKIELDGKDSTLKLGHQTQLTSDARKLSGVELNGDTATLTLGRRELAGTMQIFDVQNKASITLDGGNAVLTLGTEGREGDLLMVDSEGREVCHLNAAAAELKLGTSGAASSLRLHDDAGREVLRFADATLRVGTEGNHGRFLLRDGAGRAVVELDGEAAEFKLGTFGAASSLRLHDDAGREVLRFADATLRVGTEGNHGRFLVRDGGGRAVVELDGEASQVNVGAAGHAGQINVRDGNGNGTIQLDGNNGDIFLTNADCAEEFDFVTDVVEPGTVVVIGDDERLQPCTSGYDRRVAGVVSGAGRFRPAIVLDRRAGRTRPAVAMIGKVECKVDAGYGAIRCGDLLVSSPTPGHAMRGADSASTPGAVLGKALRGLDSGTGLVPILVCLQ